MATSETTNLQLVKYGAGTDNFIRTDYNGNLDKIDTFAGNTNEAISDLSVSDETSSITWETGITHDETLNQLYKAGNMRFLSLDVTIPSLSAKTSVTVATLSLDNWPEHTAFNACFGYEGSDTGGVLLARIAVSANNGAISVMSNSAKTQFRARGTIFWCVGE